MSAQAEFTMGGQTEDSREGRETEREGHYLNLPPFHQRAVELFPGFLCVCAGLKRHKAEALWCRAEVRGGGQTDRHLGSIVRTCNDD